MDFFVGVSIARPKLAGIGRSRPVHQATDYYCHCEERSDVAISSSLVATTRQEIATGLRPSQ